VNAADAAAYSGLLWQARALNFQAYTNRAMVANQVSIAQAVTLRSWSSYGRIATENVNTVLQAVPFVGAVTSAMENVMHVVDEMVEPIANAMVSVVDKVNGVLSTAQQAMYVSSFQATPEIVEDVVKANDERFSSSTRYGLAGLGRNLNDWKAFTTEYDEQDVPDIRRKADVVNRSLDRFSRKRNWKFFDFWMPTGPLRLVRVHREGTTRLIERETADGVEYEWKAKDTVSLTTRVWKPFKWKRYEAPIGWSEAFANAQGVQTIEQPNAVSVIRGRSHNQWFRRNKQAENFADRGVPSLVTQQESLHGMGNYSGMRAYRSLSAENRLATDPRLELRVEISMDLDTVNASDAVTSGTTFETSLVAPGDMLTSISIAEVFYEKPDQDPTKPRQDANGYNPYWDVRLKAVPTSDRIHAVALRPEDGTSITPPLANGGLGEYADSELGNFSGQSVAQLQGQVAALQNEFAGELDATQDAITNGMQDALGDAVQDILQGALAGIGVDLRDAQAIQNEIDQNKRWADGIANELTAATGNAEQRAQAVESEYERIRVAVGVKYEEVRDVIYEKHRTAIEQSKAELAQAKADLQKSFDTDEQREAAEARVQVLELALQNSEHLLFTELAEEFHSIVKSESEFLEFSKDDAYQSVKAEYITGVDLVEHIGVGEILEEVEGEFE